MPAPEFLRQDDLLTPEDLEGKDIDIVGAGSLGGAILLCLCKMGCGVRNRVRVTDFDECRLHNLPTQWFLRSHVTLRQQKVEALAEITELLCGRSIATSAARFTGAEEHRLGPIVIVAVDSIEERSRIWHNLKSRKDIELLIDGRMGAEVVEVHSVALRRDPLAVYEETLHPPEESFLEPCTHRAIIYTAFGTAAFVGSIVRSFVRGRAFPRRLAFDFRNFFIDLDGSPDFQVPSRPGPSRPAVPDTDLTPR